MIFSGSCKILERDYKEEICVFCPWSNNDFEDYCEIQDKFFDEIVHCDEWKEDRGSLGAVLGVPEICVLCANSFMESILKCGVRESDQDWCITVMKECPKDKWRR